MDKTLVVELRDRMVHPKYGKVMSRTSKVKVHDENFRRWRRRPSPNHGNPPAQRHQALAPSNHPRKSQVVRFIRFRFLAG